MKLVTIRSNTLPAVADTVKECVNQGQWILFSSRTKDRHAGTVYFLQTDSTVFELDGTGEVVVVRERAENVPEIAEVFYFGDLPQPSSLSNGALPAYSSNFAFLAA